MIGSFQYSFFVVLSLFFFGGGAVFQIGSHVAEVGLLMNLLTLPPNCGITDVCPTPAYPNFNGIMAIVNGSGFSQSAFRRPPVLM